MPYIIPETMPADWIVDFALEDESGAIADAMRGAYANVLAREHVDGLMGRLKASCLAAGCFAAEVEKDKATNAANHP